MTNFLTEASVSNLLVVLIALPMLTGILLLLLERHVRWQKVISGFSVLAGLAFSVFLALLLREERYIVLNVGDFPAPFSIVLVADLFSAAMLVMTMLVAAAVLFTSFFSIDPGRERHFYYPLFQFLIMGVNGAFLTGDLFNLFVWFEVLLISSYILVSLGGEPRQLQEGFKYVIINVIASALFLIGVGTIYSSLGTVNMADLAVKASLVGSNGLLISIGILFLVVFGIKAAIFPLYFWLPQTYFAPPTTVVAFFGGIMTKVGVYAIIRMFTLIFPLDTGLITTILFWIAGLTMVVGILGTIAQTDFKRILSWHIISQIGYMIMGLAIFTPLALAGAVYYIVHVAIVKSSLFLISGVAERLTGTSDLKKMSGLLTTHPGLAALFLVGGLTLAGVPPSSGFFGKFALVQAGLASGYYGIVVTAIVVSLFTLFSMIKVYRYSFWGEVHRPMQELAVDQRLAFRFAMPILALLIVSVSMGLMAQYAFTFSIDAANQLLDPASYIIAVLGSP